MLTKIILAIVLLASLAGSSPAKSTSKHGLHGLADLESGFHDVDCLGNICTFTYGLADVPRHPQVDVGLIEVAGQVHAAVCKQARCELIN